MSVHCYKCETSLDLEANKDISRTEECPKCYASIRVCKMCDFYDTTAYNECREPTADRIVDKEKANFCDHFRLNTKGGKKDSAPDHLAAANALFKK